MNDDRDNPLVLHARAIEPIARGGGITTVPLVGRWNNERGHVTSGITVFLPGTMIVSHSHNVEETVMVLEGDAVAYVGDERFELSADDVTWIPAGIDHHFANDSDAIMRIYWVYAGRDVTRTLAGTGETFEHLSAQDRGIGSSTTR